jgi:hypothetical protein
VNASLEADLAAVLERACREERLARAMLFTQDGEVLIDRVGDGQLHARAAEHFLPDSLRRIAVSLDEDEPDYAPSAAQSGGQGVRFERADHYILGVATIDAPSPSFARATDALRRRIEVIVEGARRGRRSRFLGFRLIARVCDKQHVMSGEVRLALEQLCDCLIDIEEALAAGRRTDGLTRRFRDTLAELVARPKAAGSSFQRNLEILHNSVSDLEGGSITPDRLVAIIGGLEVAIETWPLP